MTHCHICERETETYGEMDPGKGVVLKCCVCKAPARLAAAPSPSPSAALAIIPAAPRPPRIVAGHLKAHLLGDAVHQQHPPERKGPDL